MDIAKTIPGPEGRRLYAFEPQTVRPFTQGFHVDLTNSVEAWASCVLGRIGDVDRREIALLRLCFDVTFQSTARVKRCGATSFRRTCVPRISGKSRRVSG